MSKSFVAVRTQYYKSAAGKKEIAHSLRIGEHKNNENVTMPENQGLNIYSFDESKFDELEARHKESAGRKPQGTRNAIFEHVLVFSEDQFNKHGPEAHKAQLDAYMQDIKEEYGFEPMGYALHMDEGGAMDGKRQKVNTHCHVYFYNYDFKKKIAPLRDLMIKGKNEIGQTNKLNPNFVKMQDVAKKSFEKMGYERGISKNVTGLEHRTKEQYVKDKINEFREIKDELVNENVGLINGNLKIRGEARTLKTEIEELKEVKKSLKQQIKIWCNDGLNYMKKSFMGFKAEKEAKKTLDSEPKDINIVKTDEFYNELVNNSGNEEIKKQRNNRKSSNSLKPAPPKPRGM
jgi:hypothetical protein